MKYPAIYKIESKCNPERIYIGSASNIQDRWNRHKRDLKNNKHHSIKLQRHYNKYGVNDLLFIIIEPCLPEFLILREQYYLDILKPYFNTNIYANSPKGIKRGPVSESVKYKISIAQKGIKRKPMTEEQRLKMIKSITGLKRSKETKLKMKGNKNSLGHKHNEDTKHKMSVSHTGTKKLDEVKLKMSESGKLGWIKRKQKYNAVS
jgi:group I intron endonuclease